MKKYIVFSYHNVIRSIPGSERASCRCLQFGKTIDRADTKQYETGRGKKLHTPAMVLHFPPTNSMDKTNPENTTDTLKNPSKIRRIKYNSYQGQKVIAIAKSVCVTKAEMRVFFRPKRSDIMPLTTPPSATPNRNKTSARVFKYALSQTSIHSDTMVSPMMLLSHSHWVHSICSPGGKFPLRIWLIEMSNQLISVIIQLP